MARRRGFIGILWRGAIATVFAAVIAFAGLVALWSVARPISMLMIGRLVSGESYTRRYVGLRAIAPVLVETVIASEDARFCHNAGVDWGELREVMDDPEGPSRGASTITMQVAKNLFLWPGRSAVRKGIEIPIALILGTVWSKSRTMEIYLNIAEWGDDGVFGIDAAARRAFGKSASDLDARESALLATALPNPKERDPAHPSLIQRRLAARLASRVRNAGQISGCVRR